MVEFFECDRVRLNDDNFIGKIMQEAAVASGATVVKSVFHHFSPHGVSGVVVIAESHLAIHTWPEYGYAAVDLFTCGDSVNPETAFDYLEVHLQAQNYTAIEMKRGLLKLESGELVHKPDCVA